MKKFMIPGAAAVATAALSLLLGGGVANAQEAAQAPAPVQVPAIHVVDALDSAIKDAPQAPAVPASDVLTFLSDSINLLGRDILSTKDFSAKSLSTLVKAENTPADPQDPKGNGALDMVLKVVPYVVPLLAIPALAVPGAGAGALAGAAIAAFAGAAAALLVEAPFLLASFNIVSVPAGLVALVAGLTIVVAGIVAAVSGIVTGLMLLTLPLWVPVGIILIVLSASGVLAESGIAFFTTPVGGPAWMTPAIVLGIILIGLGLLPGLVLVIAGLLFGIAGVIALLSIPVFALAAFLFLGVFTLVCSLGLFPAIVAFLVVGGIAAVVTLPVGGVLGGVAGGLAGGVLAVVAMLIYGFVIAPRLNRKETDKKAVKSDFALAA